MTRVHRHPERSEGPGASAAPRRRCARSFAALRRTARFIHPRSSAFIGGLLLIGCSGYTGPRSVANDDPAVKIPQIQKAVEKNDRSVQPQLVKDLDADDAAVRFYAIEGLARFNDGERLGYDWKIADRHDRRPAIERWRAKLGLDSPTISTTQETR